MFSDGSDSQKGLLLLKVAELVHSKAGYKCKSDQLQPDVEINGNFRYDREILNNAILENEKSTGEKLIWMRDYLLQFPTSSSLSRALHVYSQLANVFDPSKRPIPLH